MLSLQPKPDPDSLAIMELSSGIASVVTLG